MVARENLVGVLKRIVTGRTAVVWALLIFLLALTAVSQSCKKHYKEPEFKDVQITSFKMNGITSAKFGLDAEVYNPNSFSFKIVGVEGTIYSHGIQLATFSSDDVLEVGKLSQQVYSLFVTVNIVSLEGAMDIVANSDNHNLKGLTVDLTANVKKAGVTVPVTRTGIPMSKFFKNGLPFDKLF